MKTEQILQLPSMPLQSPSFPRGPYRFTNREYLVVQYRSCPDAIRHALPEPLEPDGDVVAVQWLDLPDGTGLGGYSAAAQVIPCRYQGEACNFISQMYLDNTSPLQAGREIWGYPMKYGQADLHVEGDTLTGTLVYAGQRVATGTMTFKHDAVKVDVKAQGEHIGRTQITLKLIPDVDGKPAVAQLVAINFTDVVVHGAWAGKAALELIPHVNAPLGDLPVRQVVGGLHLKTDMTLPYGRVLHDYLEPAK